MAGISLPQSLSNYNGLVSFLSKSQSTSVPCHFGNNLGELTMWALPDIRRLNADAHAIQSKLERNARRGRGPDGKKLTCIYEDHHECRGKIIPALWRDIFSDDFKGVFGMCEHHYDYYGLEGYFECDSCGGLFTENYTWELYFHDDDDGRFCLNCYRNHYLADESHWIDLTNPLPEITDKLVHKSPHLFAVGQDSDKLGFEFLGNTEFDSWSGECISGAGNREIADLLQQAKEQGYKRAFIALDAAYQFAVSIAVYVEKAPERKPN
jgi:hypothetical protein